MSRLGKGGHLEDFKLAYEELRTERQPRISRLGRIEWPNWLARVGRGIRAGAKAINPAARVAAVGRRIIKRKER